MKKLIGPFAKVGGALFAVGVFVIIVSLSYSALGRIFPGRLFDQSAGMLLFDAAAIVWFLTFIGNSTSTSQYVFSGLGFGLGVLGSVGLIGIEVGISSSLLAAADMVKPLTYVFIGAAIGHLLLLYAFHGSAPEIGAKISLGVEKARVHDEGMRQAEISLKQNMGQMGEVISARLIQDVLQELNMRPRQIIDSNLLPVDDTLHVPSNGYPLNPQQEKTPSFFEDPRGWFNQKFRPNQTEGPQVNEQVVQQVQTLKPEEIAASSNFDIAWRETPTGRRRIFCKECKREEKEWLTDEPCEHILNASDPQPGTWEMVAAALRDVN